MTRSALCCSFVMTTIFLLATGAEAAQADSHLAAFTKSMATWKRVKAECGGNYSYKIRWSSWVGFGNETEIVCHQNKVTERKYREWKGGPVMARPGKAAKPKENSWTEKGDQIGANKKGAPPKTLDELYIEAGKVLETKLSPHQKLYVRYDKQGLLKSCFYVDTRIADDAPRKGVMISSIALGKPDGGTSKASKGRTINLGIGDNGKTVKATVGDLLLIKLKANPSTGFIWAPADQAKGSAVKFISRKFLSVSKMSAKIRPMPGQGGETTFTYRVAGTGKATISLSHKRPWEKKTKPAKTFNVTIEADAGPATVVSPKTVTGGDPKTVAAGWLDGLGDKGLVIVEKAPAPGFVGRPVIGRKDTMFVLSKPGWYVSLGFSGAIGPDTPLATVKQRFKYIALDRLPTPGLDVKGWEIRPQTSRSSFRDGVEILACGGGKIKLRVKTKFFALYGRDPSVLVPADAPSPKGSYFQIRKQFPLDLTIDAPLAMKK